MKRTFYSIPVFVLLAAWTLVASWVVWISIEETPRFLTLLAPIGFVTLGAFTIHRRFAARGRHVLAAAGACAVLGVPLVPVVDQFLSPLPEYEPSPNAVHCQF